MADYDEQAAIEAALAASLQTAQDDEKRRRDKYGIISAIPVVPDSAYTQNRPSSFTSGQQPGSNRSLGRSNVGQRATVSGAIGQRSQSTESPTSGVTSPWASERDRQPASEIARPRPRKSTTSGESLYNEFTNAPAWAPLNTKKPPSLPSVPPNAKNGATAEYAQVMPRSQTLQRPIKTSDAMQRPIRASETLPRPIKPSEGIPRRDVKSSGNTPVHTKHPPARPPPLKTNVGKKTGIDDADNLITLSPDGKKKDPFDFELSDLDPLCNNPLDFESHFVKMPPRPSSVPTVPTTQARQSIPSAQTPYYYDSPNAAPKFVMPATDLSRALVPVSKPPVNSPIIPGQANLPNMASNIPSNKANMPTLTDTNLSMMRPPSVPSNLPISSMALQNVSRSSTPLSQTPVSSASSDSANKTLDLVPQRVRGATGGATAGASHTSTPSTPGLASGDLMDFTEEKDMEELFSLEAFDPLYSLDLVTPSVEKETSTLFAGTSPQGAPENAAANSLNTSSSQGSISQEAKQQKQDEAGESTEESFELQDPFSISMLTSSLETKRKKYEEERKARELLLRKKVEEKPKPPTTQNAAKRQSFSRCNSHISPGKESTYETLQEFHETADEEIRAFCQMVARLKKQYNADDPVANRGLVISPTLKHPPYQNMSVKLVVHTHLKKEPVTFTCNLNVPCELVIFQVLEACEKDTSTKGDYILKVHGISEYLLSTMLLGSYEYVQQCLKLDQDIKLVLVVVKNINKGLKRTADDDKQPVFVPKHRDIEDKDLRVTMNKMNILMETFYKEVEKLRDSALQHGCGSVHCKSVVQAVKAICATLCKIETIDIIKAINRLMAVTIERTLHVATPKDREAFIYVTEEGDTVGAVYDSEIQRLSEMDDLHLALEDLTQSVKALIELYCRTFHTEFRFESAAYVSREKRDLLKIHENLLIHVASMHRVPLKWRNTYEEFKVITGLYYGGRRICPEVMTQITPCGNENSFQETMIFDEWIQFEPVFLCALPREARLTFTLVGVKTVNADKEQKGMQKINNPLGWVALQVFNHKFELAQGSQLLGLWIGEAAHPTGTSQSNTESPSSVLLQVNLPVFDFDVVFPTIEEAGPCLKQEFASLHPSDQDRLQDILEKDAITRLTPDEAEFLYEKRNFLWSKPEALSKVLMAVPRWDFNTLRETYTMISGWNNLSNIQAMELMLPSFADSHVRTKAVSWIGKMTDDQMLDYLPQLIQSLKFECYHNCALARLLLERSIFNIRVAFYLYWYLKEAAEDFRYRKRFQLLFGALLSVAGASLRKEFSKQEDFTKMLASIAEKVKSGKDKEGILRQELVNMFHFLQHSSIRLPLNPSMEVDMRMDVDDAKSCSYFTSNAFPLKLVLKNVDPKAEPIYIMFKVGDDLRQDMLTMQMIRIMDKLWLADGLDLKIITFRCLTTGQKKGMVELVTESETLRKIQVKHGHLAGPFKDRTISEWLQGQNPTELEYQKAVDNFIASCAGYCVATYILGICDRHNDNIMIKNSGHLFHIDFGKFLGDSQMFGNFKRDRTPFVLTSDMAYVINGGDKPSHKFQIFVDLCCQAFNILRRHADLFLTLFCMMSRSGIPGVDDNATKYVQRALMPDYTDTEATAFFTRMIEESLKSMFTQINFFFHNLAQMKFSGHQEGALLSFQPKTISMAMDGRIANVEVFGYQKRYNPEKYYIFILRVDRENQRVPSIIFRRYSEFQELHNKLLMAYPLARLHSLPGKVFIGRAHVKTVAEARKVEIEKFLRQLFQSAPEVTESNLVYTFFHPMLRDEQDIDKTNLHKLKDDHKQRRSSRTIQGEVKLAISYENDELVIMVMHVKDLCGEIGDAPDPYVKLYLLPDPTKTTKRKTKISRDSFNPTFNEVLGYRLPAKELQERTLQVSVWNYNSLEENEFLGAVFIQLSSLDLQTETKEWYKLQALHYLNTS